MTTRDNHWGDAVSAAEVVEILRRPPARNVLRDEIALVIDYEEKGLHQIVTAEYDPENKLLVLGLG